MRSTQQLIAQMVRTCDSKHVFDQHEFVTAIHVWTHDDEVSKHKCWAFLVFADHDYWQHKRMVLGEVKIIWETNDGGSKIHQDIGKGSG